MAQLPQSVCPRHRQELAHTRSLTWVNELHFPDIPREVQLDIIDASRLRFVGGRIRKMQIVGVEAYEIKCPPSIHDLALKVVNITVRYGI